MNSPQITVVIPTRNRPELVVRAVRSALAQSFAEIEVIVVIDGPDGATSGVLEQIKDDRLRVVALKTVAGGGVARNAGVQLARSRWVAFLDDDDEWMPEKVAKQYEVALRSRYPLPVISCRMIAKDQRAEYVWPRRLPCAKEHFSEYLFLRGSLFQGEGMVQTSTIFAPTELLRRVPFREVRKHQDWDWLLRVLQEPGTGLEFCESPLSIYHIAQDRKSISTQDDWLFSLAWAQSMQAFMTPRAYAAFLLTVVAGQVATNSRAGYARIMVEALRRGKPTAFHLFLFVGMAVVPRSARHKIRALLTRQQSE